MDQETMAVVAGAPALLIGGTLIQPIVDALKSAFLSGKYAALVAIFIGTVLGALGGVPISIDTGNWAFCISTAIAGLGAGAMASRNFSTAKAEGVEEGVAKAKA